MSDRYARTLVDAVIVARRWTTDECVRHFADTARDMGEPATLSAAQLKRWRRGRLASLPRPTACRVAERLFGYPMEELLASAPAGFVLPASAMWDTPPGVAAPMPGSAPTLLPTSNGQVSVWSGREEWGTSAGQGSGRGAWAGMWAEASYLAPGLTDGVRERGAPFVVSSRELEALTTMVASESSRHAAGAGGGLSPTTLEQVSAGVEELAVRYAATPPLLMLERARHARDTAYYALDRTRRPARTADLYLAAGHLCGLMARASFDLGAWSAAEEQARAACVYAELVDHPGLHAWARGTLAMIAYWARFPRQAITQVEAGLNGAPDGAARARLHAIEARAWAYVGGDLSRVTDVLAAGEEALSAGDGDADRYVGVGGEFAWGPAAHMACASTALCAAGDPAAAAKQARTALALISEGGDSDAVVTERVQVDLASAELAVGRLDAAVEALDPVWPVAVEQRRQAMTGRLAQMTGALVGSAWRGEPEAAQLRDRIEVFCTEARTRALPAG